MNNNLKLQEVMVPLLRCPVSKSNLYIKNDFLISSSDNSIRYPIIDHTPVLINNDNSLFNTAEYNNNKCVDPKSDEGDNYKRLVSKFIPSTCSLIFSWMIFVALLILSYNSYGIPIVNPIGNSVLLPYILIDS